MSDLKGRRTVALGGLIVALGGAVIVSLFYGRIGALFSGEAMGGESFPVIFAQIRLPRTVMAFLVGGALAVSGVALQSILRNPLAEPYTLGIAGGASLGVAVSMAIGLGQPWGALANPLAGFPGAMAAAAVVFFLSRRRLFQPNSMILFGIVITLVLSSLVFLLVSVMDPDRMQVALMWLLGDLSTLETSLVPWYVPLLVLPSVAIMFFGREMDILSLGPEKAGYLGVEPAATYKVLFVLTSLLAGFCVSAAGIIGFVGLIVPHILRQCTGATHGFLLVASYLGGAFYLVIADVFSRYLLYPVELPVGVVTGLLGGLILLSLLVRRL